MTSPNIKSPEEVIVELKLSEERVRAIYGTAVTVGEDWLRSSLASVLRWSAENGLAEKETKSHASELPEWKWYNAAIDDCRSILLEHAEKIEKGLE